MEIVEYQNIYRNEEKHFFYRANHALFLSFISDLRTKKRRPLRILDAGCGMGLLAKKLKKFGDVTGVDISPSAIHFSKKRGINVKKASVNKLPFKLEVFDIIVSMDVLYHQKVDDKRAFHEFLRVLKPGGIILMRVPALPILFSSHDKFVHTRERYTKKELLKKLARAGFEVQKITFVNTVLFIPALLKATFEEPKHNKSLSSINNVPQFLNELILHMLLIENFFARYFSLPIGIGLFAVAKKQKNT